MAKTQKDPTTTGVDISSAIGHGSAKIKKKIRDISRLLKKDNLPSDVRVNNERALAALKSELENAQLNLKAKKLSAKYHKVRFFERKKAARRYKQAKQELDELEAKKEQLQDDKELKEIKKEIKKQRKVFKHCEVDLAYVLNFPKTEKYIALYPTSFSDPSQLDEKAKKGLAKTEALKTELKRKFSDQLEAGKLEVSIEDGLKGIRTQNVKADTESNDVNDLEQNEQDDDDFFE